MTDVADELAAVGIIRITEMMEIGLPEIAPVDIRNQVLLNVTDVPPGVALFGHDQIPDLECLDPYMQTINEGVLAAVYQSVAEPDEAFFVLQLVTRPAITTVTAAADVFDQLCLYPEAGTLRRVSETFHGETLVVHNVEPAHDDNPSLTVYRFDDGLLTVAFGFDEQDQAPVSQDLEQAMITIVDLAADAAAEG